MTVLVSPKVGFIPISNTFFGFELSEKVMREAMRALEKLDVNLFVPFDGVISSVGDAIAACRKCLEEDVDLAIVFFCSWSNEEIPNAIASELFNRPILLWSIPVPEELISPCGLVAAASNLKRMGIRFGYVFGAVDDPETLRRIRSYALVCAAIKKLKRAKIGIIGYNCPGMIDVTFDEVSVRKLGPEIVHLSLLDLMDRYNSIVDEAVSKDVDDLMKSVGGLVEPTRSDVVNAVKMYYALREIADQYRLDAISVRCWPELREKRGILPCYGLSRLSDEGVMGVCENDAMGAVMQMILYWLSGLPPFIGDLGAIYQKDNVIQLWHCGAAATKLAPSLRDIYIRSHSQTGVGVELEFPLKPGNVTIARITRPMNGKFGMLITTGQVLPAEKKLRGNPANIKLDVPVSRFLDALIRGGVEHHLIMAYGDLTEELRTLCELMDLDPIIP